MPMAYVTGLLDLCEQALNGFLGEVMSIRIINQ